MSSVLRSGLMLFPSAVLLIAGPSQPVSAQGKPASSFEDPWTFQVAPNLWAMGFKGTVATLPPLPAASVDAGFDDLIENLAGAVMLQAEARKGQAGIFVDILYSNLSADGSTPGALFSGTSIDVEMFAPTLLGYAAAKELPL